MKRSSLQMILVFTCAGAFGAGVSFARSGPEESAIRQAANDFVDAYDRGNARCGRRTLDEGRRIRHRFQQPSRAATRSPSCIGEFLRAHPGSKMDVKIDSIRVLAPTVAIEEGTASVKDSPNGPPSASAYSAVHVKQGDKWLMASVRESEMPSVQVDRDLNELDWLVGKWTASKDAAKVTLDCDWIANKHFLRAEVSMQGSTDEMPGGMQIIGRDPDSGQIVSWFFSADGGYGTGIWQKDGSRWVIQTAGIGRRRRANHGDQCAVSRRQKCAVLAVAQSPPRRYRAARCERS